MDEQGALGPERDGELLGVGNLLRPLSGLVTVEGALGVVPVLEGGAVREVGGIGLLPDPVDVLPPVVPVGNESLRANQGPAGGSRRN